jgi:hypothetical protein
MHAFNFAMGGVLGQAGGVLSGSRLRMKLLARSKKKQKKVPPHTRTMRSSSVVGFGLLRHLEHVLCSAL